MSKPVITIVFIALSFFNTAARCDNPHPDSFSSEAEIAKLKTRIFFSEGNFYQLQDTVKNNTQEKKDTTKTNSPEAPQQPEATGGGKPGVKAAEKPREKPKSDTIPQTQKKDTAKTSDIKTISLQVKLKQGDSKTSTKKLLPVVLNSKSHLIKGSKNIYADTLSARKGDPDSNWMCDTSYIVAVKNDSIRLIITLTNVPAPISESQTQTARDSSGHEVTNVEENNEHKLLQDLKAFAKKYIEFSATVAGLFLLLIMASFILLIGFLRLKNKYQLVLIGKDKEEETEKIETEEDEIEEDNIQQPIPSPTVPLPVNFEKNILSALEHLQTAEEELKEIKPESSPQVFAPLANGAYFICEALMTAGPRKKVMSDPEADKDLGEDVCGFVSNSKEVLVWLLDGTSDLHCLKHPYTRREYFSSRLLAQGVAVGLRDAFKEGVPKSLDTIMSEIIRDLKINWTEEINNLPDDEKDLLKTNIENKNWPECAATLLTARLGINGEFVAYRSGDSKMLLFSHGTKGIEQVYTRLSEKNDESNDRIFFRLILDSNRNFEIQSNEPKFELITLKDISHIVTFSDGIGMVTEGMLKDEYKQNPDKTRNEIITHSQGTADDKSICFVEIKQINA